MLARTGQPSLARNAAVLPHNSSDPPHAEPLIFDMKATGRVNSGRELDWTGIEARRFGEGEFGKERLMLGHETAH
jgi:hypothetical protein